MDSLAKSPAILGDPAGAGTSGRVSDIPEKKENGQTVCAAEVFPRVFADQNSTIFPA